MSRTLAALALAQLAAGFCCMVMENVACVSRYAAKSPREFATADCVTLQEKMPAATWPFVSARSHARRTARARVSGESAAVAFTKRFTRRYVCFDGNGSKPGSLGWLCAKESDAAIAPRSEFSSTRFVVARAVRPSTTVRTETFNPRSATF